MQRGPFIHETFKPGKVISHCNPDRFVFILFQAGILTALIFSSVFSDGIVLRNGMQIVVTIQDTSGDTIRIQEGMWEAGIAKSLIGSFWYKGNQYSYVNNNKVTRFSPSTVTKPIKEFNPPNVTISSDHDSTSISQKPENNIDHSREEGLLLSPDKVSAPGMLQSRNAANIAPPDSTIPDDHGSSATKQMPENSATISQKEDLLPLPDTATLANIDFEDDDTILEKSDESDPLPLFDSEYTNEELIKKKRVYNILLAAGCALGATSTAVFLVNGSWDAKILAVPFMSGSIPLITVGTKKSIEYSKRLKSAEYKKHRAQMSLSLQIQRADLLITF